MVKPGRWRAQRADWAERARAFVFSTPIYRLTLRNAKPVRVRPCAYSTWPLPFDSGEEILKGQFSLAGQTLTVTDIRNLPAPASDAWISAFHAFVWLDALRAAGGETTRQYACDRVANWLDAYGTWTPVAWRADVLATRLCQWMQNRAFLAESNPGFDSERFTQAIAAQARHLKRVRGEIDGHDRIRAYKALVLWTASADGLVDERECSLAWLEEEIGRQINPDGGHVSRSPATQMAVLRDLLDVRALLLAQTLQVPVWLQAAIDRMVPMLRGFRHGDGRLALFNGTQEGRREDVDITLAQAAVKSKPLANAPHTGFQRLTGGRTLVIIDSGPPPAPGFDRGAHAGGLSFEMSVGRERLVVNCGAHCRPDGPWATALRATAAHSTLGVEDVNSAEILGDGTIGRRPSEFIAARREVDGNVLIEASHDGYQEAFGIIHRRSLYLAPEGTDFRGEDVLEGPGSRVFAIRFHLHPAVQASMIHGGDAILLKMASGAGWQFRSAGGALRLEESVYFGDCEPRRSEQIVVLGRLDRGRTTVKWRLHALG